MGSIRAGIVGFSGYSGQELMHLLAHHPDVEPVLLEHREQREDERPIFDEGAERIALDPAKLGESGLDAVLLATHHDVSLEVAPAALEAGQRAVTGFRTDRANTRFEAIEGMRAANAQAAAEADRFAQELAAQIRGQDMQAIVQQLSQTGQNTRAQMQAATADADREAQLQVDLAQLRQDLEIAVLNNDTDLAQTIQQQIGAYERELLKEDGKNRRGQGSSGPNLKDYRKFLKESLTAKINQTNPDTNSSRTVLARNNSANMAAVVARGLEEGLSPAGILNTIQAVQVEGPGWNNWGAKRSERVSFYQGLLRGGMKRPQAIKITKKLLGSITTGGQTGGTRAGA